MVLMSALASWSSCRKLAVFIGCKWPWSAPDQVWDCIPQSSILLCNHCNLCYSSEVDFPKLDRWIYKKKEREKSRKCHNHKPQPFPDPKRKRKPTNLNKHKPNKRTKSTKISSLFPKRGNRNTKRTEKHKNKMTHGKTYNQSPRRINHKATNYKTNTGTTALERSAEQTTGGFEIIVWFEFGFKGFPVDALSIAAHIQFT